MSCIVEENIFNCDLVPSLEDIIIVNLVTKLWKGPYLEDAMCQHLEEFYDSCGEIRLTEGIIFNQMRENISEKISLLPLPNLLKLKVNGFVVPIGLQIFNWIVDYDDSYSFYKNPRSYLDSLQWTMEGTIDAKKEIQLKFYNNTIHNNETLFIKACNLCLEDDIINLWRLSSDSFKKCMDYQCECNQFDTYKTTTIKYWVHYIKNELPSFLPVLMSEDICNLYNCNHSIDKNMVSSSILECNSVAVKWFWQKLTEEEVNNYLVSWVEQAIYEITRSIGNRTLRPSEFYESADTLWFLLSKMNDKEKQIKVYKKHNETILVWLLYYKPCQKFLLPVIQEMWDYLDEVVYGTFLSTIAMEIKKGISTEKLLMELWYHSPMNFKKCIIQLCINCFKGRILLWHLLEIDDLESTRIILSVADVEEKKQIIFAMVEDSPLELLIYDLKFVLLDKFIRDNLSLGCEINNFKEKVVLKQGKGLCQKWICEDNWQKIDKLFVWSLMSQDKIEQFKQTILDQDFISNDVLKKYDLLNKCMHWCFNSEEKINQFKKENCFD